MHLYRSLPQRGLASWRTCIPTSSSLRTPPIILIPLARTSGTCCHKNPPSSPSSPAPPPPIPSTLTPSFWSHHPTFTRASNNTLRCLLGCSIGDLSSLFYLQSHYPHLPPHQTMLISMTSGILTSITLETLILKSWEDMTWTKSLETAVGMSLISMIAMETAENGVEWWLTGGSVDMGSAWFWGKVGVSMGAGYLAALPYNYWRLRKFGKSCH